jgi:hypothetical protein
VGAHAAAGHRQGPAGLVLARTMGSDQAAAMGNQSGGRAIEILQPNDFWWNFLPLKETLAAFALEYFQT